MTKVGCSPMQPGSIERKVRMKQVSIAEQAIKIASFNGIDIYRINVDKFKTSSINFFFQDNLTRENVTKNALLPAVMRRGSEAYPTSRDISMQLEMLYGASFDCGVTKKGERHIIQFYTEFLSQEYIPDATDSFTAAFDLLFNIITKPAFENSRFRADYLTQEKDKLRMLIESRVNDKMQYSVERCLEEVCSGEPYGIYDYGYTQDLDAINPDNITRHYHEVLETYPLQVYLAGNISDRHVEIVKERLSSMVRKDLKYLENGFSKKQNIKSKQVNETMNITQGKLCLGFRTNIEPNSRNYPALMVYNGILGGGIHSKLFQNVREKASLAYYSFSRLEKFKGLMVVSSGIEFKNKDKALEIILKQLEEIKNGVISEQEIEATMKSMETGMKSLGDSQMNIVDFYLSQTVAGTTDNFNDVIGKIKSVTREEIAGIAADIELDTVYFLTAPEQQGKESDK